MAVMPKLNRRIVTPVKIQDEQTDKSLRRLRTFFSLPSFYHLCLLALSMFI